VIFDWLRSGFSEITVLLARLDHIVGFIEDANHNIV
jgi:hypothetical protein